MKTMKTFWMDSNLATVIKNLFSNKNQGEFIRKSVEDSMYKALKRIWHPVGYASKVSGYIYGTYCFKYFYGFYPKLKRQFVFISDIDGTSFINAFPESRDLVFSELGITPDEVIDILFIGMPETVSISKDNDKRIWNILALNNDCLACDIDVNYKAFVAEYVNAIKFNITNYSKLRYYGVRDSLGFPVDYDFENYEVNHLLNLTGHLGIVNLPDEYKNPFFNQILSKNIVDSNEASGIKDVTLENELFSCKSDYLKGISQEPMLYFHLKFKQNNIHIYPEYKDWLNFCNCILNTVVSTDGKLNSIDFDSIHVIINHDSCIFRGVKFGISIVVDNLQLQKFISNYINLPQYKKLIIMFESACIK